MQEQMRRQNSGIAASTVAGTDYLCGNSGESANDFNNDDGVNIGVGDDNDYYMLNL
jgi:hypothetical protein